MVGTTTEVDRIKAEFIGVAALLHLLTRRHGQTMDCAVCRGITQHANAALARQADK